MTWLFFYLKLFAVFWAVYFICVFVYRKEVYKRKLEREKSQNADIKRAAEIDTIVSNPRPKRVFKNDTRGYRD